MALSAISVSIRSVHPLIISEGKFIACKKDNMLLNGFFAKLT